MWVDLTTTNLVNQAEETLDAGNFKHLRRRSQGWDSTGAGSWQAPQNPGPARKSCATEWGVHVEEATTSGLGWRESLEQWEPPALCRHGRGAWRAASPRQCGSWGPISEWRNHPLSPKGASRATVNPSSDTATVLGWIFRQRNHTEYRAGQTKTLP